MIGIEFGPPQLPEAQDGLDVLETANKGLFCQMITIPLFKDHKVLVQVAGHASHTVKLLPPLNITTRIAPGSNRASTPSSPTRIGAGRSLVAGQDARRACRADERELNPPQGQLMKRLLISHDALIR